MLFKYDNIKNLKYFVLDFLYFNDLNIYFENTLYARHFCVLYMESCTAVWRILLIDPNYIWGIQGLKSLYNSSSVQMLLIG